MGDSEFFGVFDFSFKVASSPTRGRATVPGDEHEQLKTSLLVYTCGQLGAHRTRCDTGALLQKVLLVCACGQFISKKYD